MGKLKKEMKEVLSVAAIGAVGAASYVLYQKQEEKIKLLEKRLEKLTEKVKENDLIANRNGVDALASCGSSIEVLQDEFGKLSSSVRTDFDSHKEQQENRNQNLAEIIEELRQKTEELPIWVRGEFEDLQDRVAELRANQINLTNFLDDQAQTTQRVLSNQAETESTNQQKFKKIDDEIKNTTNNLEKILNEKVDDISESFDESSRILNRHEVQISQTRNQLDESANNLREEVLHLVEKTQSEVSEMKNLIDQVVSKSFESVNKVANLTEYDPQIERNKSSDLL